VKHEAYVSQMSRARALPGTNEDALDRHLDTGAVIEELAVAPAPVARGARSALAAIMALGVAILAFGAIGRLTGPPAGVDETRPTTASESPRRVPLDIHPVFEIPAPETGALSAPLSGRFISTGSSGILTLAGTVQARSATVHVTVRSQSGVVIDELEVVLDPDGRLSLLMAVERVPEQRRVEVTLLWRDADLGTAWQLVGSVALS